MTGCFDDADLVADEVDLVADEAVWVDADEADWVDADEAGLVDAAAEDVGLEAVLPSITTSGSLAEANPIHSDANLVDAEATDVALESTSLLIAFAISFTRL